MKILMKPIYEWIACGKNKENLRWYQGQPKWALMEALRQNFDMETVKALVEGNAGAVRREGEKRRAEIRWPKEGEANEG